MARDSGVTRLSLYELNECIAALALIELSMVGGTRDVDGVSVHINLFPQRAADGPYWGRHSIPLTDA